VAVLDVPRALPRSQTLSQARPRIRIRVKAATLVHAAVAALLIDALLGAWMAAEHASALTALAWLGAGAALYLAEVRFARDRARWRLTAAALLCAGVIVGAYVAVQYRHLAYPDKVAVVTGAGWMTSAWVPSLEIWQPFSNSIGTLLEGLLPLALGVMLGRQSGRRMRVAARVGFAVIAFGLFLSASRGAWIAEAVVAGAWLFLAWANGRPRPLAAGAWAMAAGLVTVTVWSLSAGSTGTASAVTAAATAESADWAAALARPDRLDLYRHSLSLVRDFPFSGIGLGDQFAMALSHHALLIQVPFLTYPHNLLLDQWLELGLPGALTWITLIAIVIVCGLAGERAALGRGFRGACLGLLATFVHGLSDARQSVDGWTWLPLFALLGLLAARLARAQIDAPRGGVTAVFLTPAALLVIVMVALWPVNAAWDANRGGLHELRAQAAGESSAARGEAMASAEAAYADAIRIDPSQPTARRRLGILSMAQARYAEAVTHLEVAVASDPDNWTSRKALGLACTWTGDVERAAYLLGSLDDPQIVGELNTWSSWRETRGELALARRAAQVSARLRPDPEIARRIARLATLP
jgi:hypothetical protein